jgi:membrane associated rhomboid family serine protease/Zn-finger nucleic acid-binding protein
MPDKLREFWKNVNIEGEFRGKYCPHCGREMKTASIDLPGVMNSLELDVCPLCQQIWFDPGEMKQFPKEEKVPEEEMPQAFKEAIAMKMIDLERERISSQFPDDNDNGPENVSDYLAGIFGLPVESNDEPVESIPLVTWGIMAACACIFGLTLYLGSEKVFSEWGFIPAEWYRYCGLTLITSFFLHGGIWHLLGNMYFLFIFGDNVENSLGKIKYILLLLTSSIAGCVLHALFDQRSLIPLIGASSGITGVLAYYTIMFPRAKIGLVVRAGFAMRWINLPVVVWMGMFILLQIIGVFKQVSGLTSTSFLGHIGGIFIGAVVAVCARTGLVEKLRSHEKKFNPRSLDEDNYKLN